MSTTTKTNVIMSSITAPKKRVTASKKRVTKSMLEEQVKALKDEVKDLKESISDKTKAKAVASDGLEIAGLLAARLREADYGGGGEEIADISDIAISMLRSKLWEVK